MAYHVCAAHTHCAWPQVVIGQQGQRQYSFALPRGSFQRDHIERVMSRNGTLDEGLAPEQGPITGIPGMYTESAPTDEQATGCRETQLA